MSHPDNQQVVSIPALFDSDEPLFLTQPEPEYSPNGQTDPSDLSFDNTGDGHDTCNW